MSLAAEYYVAAKTDLWEAQTWRAAGPVRSPAAGPGSNSVPGADRLGGVSGGELDARSSPDTENKEEVRECLRLLLNYTDTPLPRRTSPTPPNPSQPHSTPAYGTGHISTWTSEPPLWLVGLSYSD